MENYKLPVFIHIPKTAGKSIQSWIKSYVNQPNKKILTPKHQLFSDYIKQGREPEWSFAVVRNTYSRLVSLYDFMTYKSGLRAGKALKRGTFNPADHDSLVHVLGNHGIVEFFEYFCNSENDYYFPIFESQVKYTKGVDFKLKFENLHEEIKKIQDLVNCYEPITSQRNVRQQDKSRYYTPEFFRLVEKYYGDELEEFKYLPPTN